ncbi:hypothetical protein JCM11641_004390 [Rhodosporidiobolus odoratus]
MSQPSPTLYISNLPYSSLSKPELRRTLYNLFSTYGKVLDVVHLREEKVRGSAWVVFGELSASTAALRGLDGEGIAGRAMRISYARSTSHATIAHTEGPEAVYAIKLGLRDAESNGTATGGGRLTVSKAQKTAAEERGKRAREEAGEFEAEEEEEEEEDDEDEEGRERKKRREGEKEVQEEEDDAMQESDDEQEPPSAEQGDDPNPILYIEGLPAEVTTEMLSTLFQQYPGLSTLRLLPLPAGAPKNTGTAFVQYESAGQAGVAKEALDGFLVDKGVAMKVYWAKRA